ncbi:MAG: ABC transporter permease [Bacteroidaceae bacterium]|nr:ABC transporter permease [Bacteroidaceae bacterium]
MKGLNDILRIAKYEYRSMLRSLPVLLVLGGGIFFYGLLYNYMYSPNVLREVPVAIVDESRTPLSRHYIRLLDATPQVRVQGVVNDRMEARERMKKGEVSGIVFLPDDFEAKVGRGEEAVFISYNTAITFLYYAALKEASTGAMLALNDEVRPGQVVFLDANVVQPVINTRSMEVQGIALYNGNGGYATYLIPAVLMVILFQTMLMVISMRCGMEYEQRMLPLFQVVNGTSSWRTAISIVIGKSVVYVGFYAMFTIFLLGFLPLVFHLPHLASPLLLVQLMIPYLFATAFFGLSCSPFFKDSDAPLLLIAFFSVGLLFLSGISWPLELMPWPWRLLHCLLPAPVGVLAFVKANSMGADITDISREMMLLWGQCAVYFFVACFVYKRVKQAK